MRINIILRENDMALQPVATTVNVGIDKTFRLVISESAPTGLTAGTFAIADGVAWDPANKNTGKPYPVFYDGVGWQALY